MGLLWIPFWSPRREKGGVRYADVYARAVAAGIDFALLYVVLNPLFRMIGGQIYATVDKTVFEDIRQAEGALAVWSVIWHSSLIDLWLLNALIQFVIVGALIVAVQVRFGTTPGKWLLGLRIVDAKTMEPITTPRRFLLRFFAYIPAVLPLMIGIFWASFNRQRRGWHDYIAGTVVIHTRSYEWYRERIIRLYRKLRPKPDAS